MLNADEYAQLSAEERAIYDAASDEEGAAFAVKWRSEKGRPVDNAATTFGPKSMMRDIGRVGVPVTLVLGVLLALLALMEGGAFGLWAVVCAALFGFSALAWMLGAIELRLINIDETLKSGARAQR